MALQRTALGPRTGTGRFSAFSMSGTRSYSRGTRAADRHGDPGSEAAAGHRDRAVPARCAVTTPLPVWTVATFALPELHVCEAGSAIGSVTAGLLSPPTVVPVALSLSVFPAVSVPEGGVMRIEASTGSAVNCGSPPAV